MDPGRAFELFTVEGRRGDIGFCCSLGERGTKLSEWAISAPLQEPSSPIRASIKW
jgi:hypothetical protein